MSDAPERIWIEDEFGDGDDDQWTYGTWDVRNYAGYDVEYVRADLALPAVQPDADSFADLIADARLEAAKAMQKFPQPNYVISKVAEEAGEVVKAAIHCAEGRETAESVRGEIKQVIAMLYRLWVEGDQVHGLAPLAPQPKDNSNEPDYSDTLWQNAHEVLNGETT